MPQAQICRNVKIARAMRKTLNYKKYRWADRIGENKVSAPGSSHGSRSS